MTTSPRGGGRMQDSSEKTDPVRELRGDIWLVGGLVITIMAVVTMPAFAEVDALELIAIAQLACLVSWANARGYLQGFGESVGRIVRRFNGKSPEGE